jgi:hypothetical protein
MLSATKDAKSEVMEAIVKAQPIGRLCSAGELAAAVQWL